MEVVDTKITGYVLLVAGIAIIVWSLFSVYVVFTGQTQAYKLFSFEGISLDLSGIVPSVSPKSIDPESLGLPPGTQIPDGLLEKTKTQTPTPRKTEVIPSELLNDTTNIFFHLILMGFVAGVGYKIASVGAMLVRPVKVNLKEDKMSQTH